MPAGVTRYATSMWPTAGMSPAPGQEDDKRPAAGASGRLGRPSGRGAAGTGSSAASQDPALTLQAARIVRVLSSDPSRARFREELARLTGMAPASVHLILTRLADAGWVTSAQTTTDRKRRLYTLTPASRRRPRRAGGRPHEARRDQPRYCLGENTAAARRWPAGGRHAGQAHRPGPQDDPPHRPDRPGIRQFPFQGPLPRRTGRTHRHARHHRPQDPRPAHRCRLARGYRRGSRRSQRPRWGRAAPLHPHSSRPGRRPRRAGGRPHEARRGDRDLKPGEPEAGPG